MRFRRIHTVGTCALAALTITGVAAAAPTDPELLSVDSDGEPLAAHTWGGAVSDDGSTVAFLDRGPAEEPLAQVYVRDRETAETTLLYEGPPGHTASMDLSGDGSAVVVSTDDDTGDDGPNLRVRNVADGSTQWLGRDFSSITIPSISNNGRWVAFTGVPDGADDNRAYRWNLDDNILTRVDSGGSVGTAVMSEDGRQVAYNRDGHTYVRTVATGDTVVADVTVGDEPGNATNSVPAAFSATGRYLLFTSAATDLVDDSDACGNDAIGCAFRRDLANETTTLASASADGTPVLVEGLPDLSVDGRVATYVAGNQAQARRLSTHTTRTVSVTADGAQANEPVDEVAVNGDGSGVTFSTYATNLGLDSDDQRHRVWLASSGV